MNRLINHLDRKPLESEAEEYVDTAWIRKTFGIAASTLSEYRKRGVIPFTYFEEGGKIYYKKSDLYEILDRNGRRK